MRRARRQPPLPRPRRTRAIPGPPSTSDRAAGAAAVADAPAVGTDAPGDAEPADDARRPATATKLSRRTSPQRSVEARPRQTRPEIRRRRRTRHDDPAATGSTRRDAPRPRTAAEDSGFGAGSRPRRAGHALDEPPRATRPRTLPPPRPPRTTRTLAHSTPPSPRPTAAPDSRPPPASTEAADDPWAAFDDLAPPSGARAATGRSDGRGRRPGDLRQLTMAFAAFDDADAPRRAMGLLRLRHLWRRLRRGSRRRRLRGVRGSRRTWLHDPTFEEAPAEADTAPSDDPPPAAAEEDPWASFPEPVAAAAAAAPSAPRWPDGGDAEPTEGDAWAAFDGAATASRRRCQPRRDVRLPRDVVVRARVGAGRRDARRDPERPSPPSRSPRPTATRSPRVRRSRASTTTAAATQCRRPGMRAAHHRRRRSCASPARRRRQSDDGFTAFEAAPTDTARAARRRRPLPTSTQRPRPTAAPRRRPNPSKRTPRGSGSRKLPPRRRAAADAAAEDDELGFGAFEDAVYGGRRTPAASPRSKPLRTTRTASAHSMPPREDEVAADADDADDDGDDEGFAAFDSAPPARRPSGFGADAARRCGDDDDGFGAFGAAPEGAADGTTAGAPSRTRRPPPACTNEADPVRGGVRRRGCRRSAGDDAARGPPRRPGRGPIERRRRARRHTLPINLALLDAPLEKAIAARARRAS